jgi:apolipoprotein N-acyltransferase
MDWIWGLVVSIASAWFCFFIADRNNMSKIGWPILGFLLPLIGAVATMVVAYTKQKDSA